MRPLRILAAAAVLPAALLGAAGCSGSGGDGAEAAPSASASASAADPAVPTTPPPALAGGAEARALTRLPAGAATGTAVLAYSGVGEVREPFRGTCSHDGDTTRLDGTADTARIRLDVAPDGATVALDDVGLSATSQLATGRYDVSGHHLSLAAPLAQDGQEVGSVELEVDCAG